MTNVVLLSALFKDSSSVLLPTYPRDDSEYQVVMSHFIIPEFWLDKVMFERQMAFRKIDGKADEMSWFW